MTILNEVPDIPDSIANDPIATREFVAICESLIESRALNKGRARLVELYASEYSTWHEIRKDCDPEKLDLIKETRMHNAALFKKLSDLGFGLNKPASKPKPSRKPNREGSAGKQIRSGLKIARLPSVGNRESAG